MEAGPTNITVLCEYVNYGRFPPLTVSAASFACYSAIAMQTRKFDKIALVEAWGLLRDFVLLVNRRYFFAVDEPLSLLVCPAIFRAMEIIIERSGPATSASPSLYIVSTNNHPNSEYHTLFSVDGKPLRCPTGNDQQQRFY